MNHKSINQHSSVGKHPDRLSHPASAAGRIGHAAEPSDLKPDGFLHLLKALFLSLAAATITALAAVTIMTAIVGASPNPNPLIPALSAAALALASLVGGVTAGLCRRDRAMGTALISGCLLSVLLCAVALTVGGSASDHASEISPLIPWLMRTAPIPLCALGGFLTRTRPQKASHTAPNRR